MCDRKAKVLRSLFLLLAWTLQFGLSCAAQDLKRGATGEIGTLEKSLKDPSWEQRCSAFYGLLGYVNCVEWDGRTDLIHSKLATFFRAHPDRQDDMKIALIALLTTENKNVETSKTLSEGYTNYYGDVVAAVSSLRDSRALMALVGAVGTGGMATGALAEFGAASLDPVLHELQSHDSIVRAAAVRAINEFLEPAYRKGFSDGVSRQKIKAALLQAGADDDYGVRFTAVRGLAKIVDADTLGMLKKLASSDPAKLPGKATDGGDVLYPVRRAAKKALDQIEQSRSSTPTSPN